MKKIFAASMLFVMVLQLAMPATLLAATSYKDSLVKCPGSNNFYVPQGTQCPSQDNTAFFLCMVAGSAVALGAAAALSWFPPWAILAFGAAFMASTQICRNLTGGGGGATPQVNLVVSNVTLKTGTLVEGGQVTFTGVVKNSSSVNVSQLFSNNFQYRWGAGAWHAINTPSITSLSANATKTLTASAITLSQAGQLEVRLCADSNTNIAESNETDNCTTSGALAVASSPKLVPEGLTAPAFVVGALQAYSAKVRNTGGAASSPTNVRFCIDNTNCSNTTAGQIASLSLPALAPGAVSGALAAQWRATSGNHTLYFCVVGGSCVSQSLAPTCRVNGVTLQNGQSQTFYNPGDITSGTCASIRTTCVNGVLSPAVPAAYTQTICAVVVPPQSEVVFTTNSTLVRTGTDALLSWDGGNATSCTVTGTNGFSSRSLVKASGVSTGPITQKTVFSIRCTRGATTKQAEPITINQIANLQEI